MRKTIFLFPAYLRVQYTTTLALCSMLFNSIYILHMGDCTAHKRTSSCVSVNDMMKPFYSMPNQLNVLFLDIFYMSVFVFFCFLGNDGFKGKVRCWCKSECFVLQGQPFNHYFSNSHRKRFYYLLNEIGVISWRWKWKEK